MKFSALIVPLLIVFSTAAAEYEAGADYEIRGETLSSEPEVREFFSYFCGHCYNMRWVYQSLADHLEGRARVVKNPVGGLGGPMGNYSVTAYALARLYGVEEEFDRALLARIHEEHNPPGSETEFDLLLGSLGLSGTFIEEHREAAREMVLEYFNRARDASIMGVPGFLVNDRYLVRFEKIRSIGDLKRLVDYLLKLD